MDKKQRLMFSRRHSVKDIKVYYINRSDRKNVSWDEAEQWRKRIEDKTLNKVNVFPYFQDFILCVYSPPYTPYVI